MAQIKQGLSGEFGIQGADGGDGGFVNVSAEYIATSIDKVVFVAPRAYVVKSITGRPTVIGSDGGAVTAVIKKAASGTAIASGVALHSGTYDLKGTANTPQALSVTDADAYIPAGTAIGIDFTGTLTAATGVVSIVLAPA
jgi:hypothetical protein